MRQDNIEQLYALGSQYISTRGGGELIRRPLGHGGSAAVFKWNCSNSVWALKIYDPRFFSSENADAERHRLQLQRRLIDQHCDSLIDTLEIEEVLGTCFLKMEFFDGSELKKVIEKVPNNSVSLLINQLISAVKFLEQFSLVHRDIKPENILVSSDFASLKLLDLGVIREISCEEERANGTDHGERKPFIATAQYSSPEYLFRLESPSELMWKALTIYQVGAVLHDLVCKQALFQKIVVTDNKYALAMAVMKDQPDFSGVPPDMAEWAALAAKCLTKDSALRLQLVNWSSFEFKNESASETLKKKLAARSVNSNQEMNNEARHKLIQEHRKKRTLTISESIRQKIINEYGQHIRVEKANSSTQLLVILPDETINVLLAPEYTWQSGLRENFAVMHFTAIATSNNDVLKHSFQRRPIGEIQLSDQDDSLLIESIFSEISQVLSKYMSLLDINNLEAGTDLVALTWSNKH